MLREQCLKSDEVHLKRELQGQDDHLSHLMVDIDDDPPPPSSRIWHVRVFAEFLRLNRQTSLIADYYQIYNLEIFLFTVFNEIRILILYGFSYMSQHDMWVHSFIVNTHKHRKICFCLKLPGLVHLYVVTHVHYVVLGCIYMWQSPHKWLLVINLFSFYGILSSTYQLPT